MPGKRGGRRACVLAGVIGVIEAPWRGMGLSKSWTVRLARRRKLGIEPPPPQSGRLQEQKDELSSGDFLVILGQGHQMGEQERRSRQMQGSQGPCQCMGLAKTAPSSHRVEVS